VVGQPEIYTRRAFLARTAAATAAVVAGGGLLAACNDDGPSSGALTPPPDDPLAGVMSVAVHPAIGIARVGNSADSFFFAPELPGAIPVAPDGFKDAAGAIARQAARFRIYGYDAAGDVVGEITGADATIAWTVSPCLSCTAIAPSGSWQPPPRAVTIDRSACSEAAAALSSAADTASRALRSSTRISIATIPCPGAGMHTSTGIAAEMRAPSPSRFRPAAASTSTS